MAVNFSYFHRQFEKFNRFLKHVQSDQNMMKPQLSRIPMNSCEFFIWGFIIFSSDCSTISLSISNGLPSSYYLRVHSVSNGESGKKKITLNSTPMVLFSDLYWLFERQNVFWSLSNIFDTSRIIFLSSLVWNPALFTRVAMSASPYQVLNTVKFDSFGLLFWTFQEKCN